MIFEEEVDCMHMFILYFANCCDKMHDKVWGKIILAQFEEIVHHGGEEAKDAGYIASMVRK